MTDVPINALQQKAIDHADLSAGETARLAREVDENAERLWTAEHELRMRLIQKGR